MNKSKILKIIISTLIILAAIVGVVLFIKSNNITSMDSFMALVREIVDRSGVWGPIVYTIIMTISGIFLSFIPGTTFAFIVGSIVFNGPWVGLLISASSVLMISLFLFFIGDKFGEKAAIKIVGEEAVKKAQALVDKKSKTFLPLMFLFPMFPDDALCVVAGMTKMSYRYFTLIVIVFRTVGIATTIFLADLLPALSLGLIDYIIIINIILIDLYLIFKYQNQIEKIFTEKRFRKAIKLFKESLKDGYNKKLLLYKGTYRFAIKNEFIIINIIEDYKPYSIIVNIVEEPSTKTIYRKKFDNDITLEELVIDLDNRTKFKL